MARVKPGSKYYGLFQFLARRREESLTLAFSEIEAKMDDRLPASARSGKSFWSNRGRGSLQAAAWMDAGYHVVAVDLEEGCVTFARPVPRYTVRREGDTIRWDSAMIRALRVHLGVNQAELAELLGVRQQTVSEWETGIYAPTRARSKHLTLVAEQAGFPFEPGSEAEA